MLRLEIESREMWDENKQEFVTTPSTVLKLEHSLVSISKWEAKHKKPFLMDDNKTREEILDYIKCMIVEQDEQELDDSVIFCLTDSNFKKVKNYLEDKQTATWFTERPGGRRGGSSGEQVTSELVYYWMTAYQIPFETQYWNFNRLMTLIRICSLKQEQPKKRGRRDVLNQQAALNAARRKKLGTKG